MAAFPCPAGESLDDVVFVFYAAVCTLDQPAGGDFTQRPLYIRISYSFRRGHKRH